MGKSLYDAGLGAKWPLGAQRSSKWVVCGSAAGGGFAKEAKLVHEDKGEEESATDRTFVLPRVSWHVFSEGTPASSPVGLIPAPISGLGSRLHFDNCCVQYHFAHLW